MRIVCANLVIVSCGAVSTMSHAMAGIDFEIKHAAVRSFYIIRATTPTFQNGCPAAADLLFPPAMVDYIEESWKNVIFENRIWDSFRKYNTTPDQRFFVGVSEAIDAALTCTCTDIQWQLRDTLQIVRLITLVLIRYSYDNRRNCPVRCFKKRKHTLDELLMLWVTLFGINAQFIMDKIDVILVRCVICSYL